MLTENTNWFSGARDGKGFDLDIAWIAQGVFERDSSEPIKIPVPQMTRGHFILSGDAAMAPTELFVHYKEVVSLCREFNKPLDGPQFWMSPVIVDGSGVGVSPNWFKRYSECVEWIESIEWSEEGELCYDVAQAWEFAIFGEGQFIFAGQTEDPGTDDAERAEGFIAVRLQRAKVIEQARAATERSPLLLNRLNEELGVELFK